MNEDTKSEIIIMLVVFCLVCVGVSTLIMIYGYFSNNRSLGDCAMNGALVFLGLSVIFIFGINHSFPKRKKRKEAKNDLSKM